MFYLFFVVLLLQLTTVFVQECNYKLSNDEILENTYLNRFNFILEQNKVTFGVPTQKEWNVLEGMNGDTLEIGIRRIGKEMVVLFGGNKDVIYANGTVIHLPDTLPPDYFTFNDYLCTVYFCRKFKNGKFEFVEKTTRVFKEHPRVVQQLKENIGLNCYNYRCFVMKGTDNVFSIHYFPRDTILANEKYFSTKYGDYEITAGNFKMIEKRKDSNQLSLADFSYCKETITTKLIESPINVDLKSANEAKASKVFQMNYDDPKPLIDTTKNEVAASLYDHCTMKQTTGKLCLDNSRYDHIFTPFYCCDMFTFYMLRHQESYRFSIIMPLEKKYFEAGFAFKFKECCYLRFNIKGAKKKRQIQVEDTVFEITDDKVYGEFINGQLIFQAYNKTIPCEIVEERYSEDKPYFVATVNLVRTIEVYPDPELKFTFNGVELRTHPPKCKQCDLWNHFRLHICILLLIGFPGCCCTCYCWAFSDYGDKGLPKSKKKLRKLQK